MSTSADVARTGDAKTPKRQPGRRRLLSLVIAPESTVGLALVALLVVFSVAAPGKFTTFYNLTYLLGDSSTLVVLAMAMTFVIISGNLDLSVGSIVAFSEVAAAKVMLLIGGTGCSCAWSD